MNDVEIQIQDRPGNWRTVAVVFNNMQRIAMELDSVQARYIGKRARAVDGAGRLIDLR